MATPVETDYAYLDGMPISAIQPAAATISALHTDNIGTVQRATDSTKTINWTGNYNPNGAVTPTTTITMLLRLLGQHADSTGFNTSVFRTYDPVTLARFGQGDPLGLKAGLNPYILGNNNLFKYTDRLGLLTDEDFNSSPYDQQNMAALNIALFFELPGKISEGVGEGIAFIRAWMAAKALGASGQTAAVEPGGQCTNGLQNITNPGALEPNFGGQGGAAGAQSDFDALTNVPGSVARTAPNGAQIVTLPDGTTYTLYTPSNSPGFSASMQINNPNNPLTPIIKIKY